MIGYGGGEAPGDEIVVRFPAVITVAGRVSLMT